MDFRDRAVFAAVPLALVMLTGCGGGNSNPAAPPPSAAPTPAPTPTPVPLPFGISAVCNRIGLGSAQSQCRTETPSFSTELEASIDEVVARHPEIFDLNDQKGAGGFYVKSLGQFYVELQKTLESRNLCGVFDGEEMGIKNVQTFNDQYKVVLSDNHLRRGPSSYRSTCYPAAMPLSQGEPPHTANCNLAPSRSIACSNEGARFDVDMENSIQAAQAAHPELFSGDTVLNVPGYESAVSAELTRRGYCAMPGEEMGVKNKNDFSESYDILLANGKIRHNGYRVTCYPADF